ncbi:branched-chain amino acid ABC transporter permease [Parasphaerochaeta coccoides]|uniref:Amino acid/amide ABC transporter membrane protein 1, HAAT family n=1 Tax=Parasphaerochaeta coccoides (strain ATCC BAA-1237 / DSM 17374 / SPN1) TaxID=760011 RepID=F4GHZ1_PARC1|nr:branched-chain amino acid ABC transporter permease [Parasphaerochaeta coccoides]AEC02104.1 amino acid/amide ABC transporter membrane protein 1, HAAT family [Parasphaerochaeta coccoides DSM 17374]
MSFHIFLQHLTNGLSLGSLYALVAIGYTMVYGILRLINFAHGDIFMLGAYFAYYAISVFFLPWWVGAVVAIGLTCATGLLIERVAYRPLRNSPRISVMISAIGVSFFLENLATVIFGGRPKAFPVPAVLGKSIMIGKVSIMPVSLIIPVATLVILLALMYVVHRTRTGMAMRAVSRDYTAAKLMGIDVNRIIAITFATGSILAAFGGIMWGLKYPQLQPLMGVMPGIKCFIAAVLGGIGNIMGAVLGGLVLGLAEILITAFLPALSGYRDAIAFVILIAILLLKPSGILGTKVTEKV